VTTRPRRAERQKLRAAYDELRKQAREILNRLDPVGLIAAGAPGDEYDLEVSTILPRLRTIQSAAEARRVVHEEFQYWFEDSAGPESDYDAVAEQLWHAWLRSRISAPRETSGEPAS
jgi:hypothetical protein